tara:strand:+ start:225 stop:488 length:264 start_codon:yes stop_codon:yes gene_type:complete
LPQSKYLGLDGLAREKTEEYIISVNMAQVFSNPTGEEVLKYLRSVTIEMVGGSSISNDELRHLEGQRYIVGLIERHIARGHRNRSNE